MSATRGHIIANPGVALALVGRKQHELSNWADLTPDQLHQIGEVIRDDRRGRLTHEQCRNRLLAIAIPGDLPPEAA